MYTAGCNNNNNNNVIPGGGAGRLAVRNLFYCPRDSYNTRDNNIIQSQRNNANNVEQCYVRTSIIQVTNDVSTCKYTLKGEDIVDRPRSERYTGEI